MWRLRLRSARNRLRANLDRLLPPVCLVCGDPLARRERRVCGPCWLRAPRLRRPLCPRCGIPLRDIGVPHVTSTCIECRDWLPYLRVARAPFRMAGPAASLVHALKYGGWRELARDMGSEMARVPYPKDVRREIAGLVPIPLSDVRLRERGYNQAEELAGAVARARGWPLLAGTLERTRHTRRQADLVPAERRANVSGAFRVAESAEARVRDAHLLLVDDVLTTGSTALACVRALAMAGARAVSVLTFARARPEPGRA